MSRKKHKHHNKRRFKTVTIKKITTPRGGRTM